MSGWTSSWDEPTIQSIPETSINMTGRKSLKVSYVEKSWPPPEREEWPLIDYNQSEVKSAQELLFEVICIYLTLVEICPFSCNKSCVGSLGERSQKHISDKMGPVQTQNYGR
jgi:hypothetical protein